MKFEDLQWYVMDFKNKVNIKNSTVSIYINDEDFKNLNTNGLKYFIKGDFQIFINKFIPKNHCNMGQTIFEVLNENERIIKKLLE